MEYIIPLKKAKRCPKSKRAKVAIRTLKEFVSKHLKAEKIKLDKKLNEKIWERGMENIPPKIKIKTSKLADGTIVVALAE
jgi:large subunit ribosomal protein L31e